MVNLVMATYLTGRQHITIQPMCPYLTIFRCLLYYFLTFPGCVLDMHEKKITGRDNTTCH